MTEQRSTDLTTVIAVTRRGGGRAGKRLSRSGDSAPRTPYVRRRLGTYNVLSDEGLSLIEWNADLLLNEIGMEFTDDPEILEIFRGAGADVKGTRVRFEPGMCRTIIQRSAPRQFRQHARNPANTVMMGGEPADRTGTSFQYAACCQQVGHSCQARSVIDRWPAAPSPHHRSTLTPSGAMAAFPVRVRGHSGSGPHWVRTRMISAVPMLRQVSDAANQSCWLERASWSSQRADTEKSMAC